MNPRPPTFIIVVLCGILLVPSVAHATRMPSLGTPAEFWGMVFFWLLAITHWLWFPPLAALPIALITPGRRPITDPPSRRWSDVFACMAISFVSFTPIELIMVGLFTGDFDLWAAAWAPWMLSSRDPGAMIAALVSTLLVFAVVQAGVGNRMKRRRPQ